MSSGIRFLSYLLVKKYAGRGIVFNRFFTLLTPPALLVSAGARECAGQADLDAVRVQHRRSRVNTPRRLLAVSAVLCILWHVYSHTLRESPTGDLRLSHSLTRFLNGLCE